MSNNEFSDVIASKQANIQSKIEKENVALISPQYHAERISTFLREAVSEIDPNVAPEKILEKLMKILNSVPIAIGQGFSEKLQKINSYQQEGEIWGVVSGEWNAILEKEAAIAEREEEILNEVQSGEASESIPGKFERRTVGEHPGPSTRQIRKAKAQLRQSDS